MIEDLIDQIRTSAGWHVPLRMIADIWGVLPDTIRGWVSAGRIPPRHILAQIERRTGMEMTRHAVPRARVGGVSPRPLALDADAGDVAGTDEVARMMWLALAEGAPESRVRALWSELHSMRQIRRAWLVGGLIVEAPDRRTARIGAGATRGHVRGPIYVPPGVPRIRRTALGWRTVEE